MNKISQQANRTRWEGHVSAWLGRIKRSEGFATPMTMVPVVVRGHDDEAKSHSPIHLQHQSGWQLQLPANVPAAWLGQVLKSNDCGSPIKEIEFD